MVIKYRKKSPLEKESQYRADRRGRGHPYEAAMRRKQKIRIETLELKKILPSPPIKIYHEAE